VLRIASLALAVLMAATACGSGDDTAGGRPLVVVTTTILGDITTTVAGEGVKVEVLMPIGADPHIYEASARQGARLREAELIVANGVELEEGLLDTIAEAEAEGVTVLRVGDLLDPQPFVGGDAGHDGEEGDLGAEDDHDHEDGLDAHVWMDPIRMVEAAGLIGDALEPILGEDVLERAAGYQEELRALSDEIQAAVDTIPLDRRVLITNHFAYGYYAERYGLEILGTVIPAATTEAETSAAQFAALVDLIERERVPAIFGSTTEPATLAEAIAGEVGFPVEVIKLHTGSLGEAGSGAETYIEMMRSSTQRIVEALAG
jgi:zinc/manganese transport system substrate-binding protein